MSEPDTNEPQAGGACLTQPVRQRADRPWIEYPIATKAYGCNGGWWERTESGWKPNGSKDTFPRPGGDAVGACVDMATGITREEKRIRIAEACGVHTKHCRGWTMTHAAYRRGECGEWKHFRSEAEADEWNARFPSDDWKKEIYTVASLLPDYFGSLDAIIPAVREMPTAMRSVFLSRLADVLIEVDDGRVFDCAAANAEAFGRTLKLW